MSSFESVCSKQNLPTTSNWWVAWPVCDFKSEVLNEIIIIFSFARQPGGLAMRMMMNGMEFKRFAMDNLVSIMK